MSTDVAPYRAGHADHPLGPLLRVHRMDRWAAAKWPVAYTCSVMVGFALVEFARRGRLETELLIARALVWSCLSGLLYLWRVRGVRRVAVHEHGLELGEPRSARHIAHDAIRSVEGDASLITLILESGERVPIRWTKAPVELFRVIRERLPALP